jgi:hypothetical protein
MLSNSTSQNPSVSWSDTGDSFIIHDVISFNETVMPTYFSHNNLASFVRQLNLYGFKKKTVASKDQKAEEYEHATFLRDRPDLLASIKRKKKSREDRDGSEKKDRFSQGSREEEYRLPLSCSLSSSASTNHTFANRLSSSESSRHTETTLAYSRQLLGNFSNISHERQKAVGTISLVREQIDSMKNECSMKFDTLVELFGIYQEGNARWKVDSTNQNMKSTQSTCRDTPALGYAAFKSPEQCFGQFSCFESMLNLCKTKNVEETNNHGLYSKPEGKHFGDSVMNGPEKSDTQQRRDFNSMSASSILLGKRLCIPDTRLDSEDSSLNNEVNLPGESPYKKTKFDNWPSTQRADSPMYRFGRSELWELEHLMEVDNKKSTKIDDLVLDFELESLDNFSMLEGIIGKNVEEESLFTKQLF